MISIRAILHAYAATLHKTWEHDRSKTVGASEIGQCARKTWFSKHNAPRDPGYVDGWGARLRGTLIENHFCVPGVRAALPEGWKLLYAGDEQETLVDGYLSATTDGLLVNDATGECINIDFKSIDPRVDLGKEKSEHAFQTQVQMGLVRLRTEFRPTYSIVPYVNASFFDDIEEFLVQFSERIYNVAYNRAANIMTAPNALDLPPEGKMAGGNECAYCAWASNCAAVSVAGIPKDENPLDADAAIDLAVLCETERALAEAQEALSAEHEQAREEIKRFLRENKTRKFKGDGWSVSYGSTTGRGTLDMAAIENAGIDLSPYYLPGESSERLIVRKRNNMAPKELLIEVRVPLPEGMFEGASMLTRAQDVIETFRAALHEEFGEGFTLKLETVTKRAGAGRKKAATQEAAKQAATQEAVEPAATQEAAEQPVEEQAIEDQPAEDHHSGNRRHRNGSAQHAAA